ITLEQILDNPITLEIFKDETLISKCSENIAFIIDVTLYERAREQTVREKIASHISKKYFNRESESAINISNDLMVKMIGKLKDKLISNDGFFAEPYSEVMGLIRRNDFTRFTTRNAYNLCKTIIFNISKKPIK
ncbi:MAG: hypothetical protein Solumvirus7_10, partial [Solumvirus sp.]